MDNIVETPVVVTEAQRLASLVPNAGVPHGTTLTDIHGNKVEIVYETDASNNVTGWHTELVEGTN